MERKQFYEIGCGNCLARRFDEKSQEHVCGLEKEGYPNATRKTCAAWRARHKPRNEGG
jgi:hypothetical protein